MHPDYLLLTTIVAGLDALLEDEVGRFAGIVSQYCDMDSLGALAMKHALGILAGAPQELSREDVAVALAGAFAEAVVAGVQLERQREDVRRALDALIDDEEEDDEFRPIEDIPLPTHKEPEEQWDHER